MDLAEPSSLKRKWVKELSPESAARDCHEETKQVEPAPHSDLDPVREESRSRSPDEQATSLSITCSSSTHDTTASSFHFESIHDFTKELQTAITASWPTRSSPGYSKYAAVKVLLISWEEDDLGVEVEVDLLGQLLENVYSYEVEKWKIPSMNSFDALDEQVRASAKAIRSNPSSLFVLYYAGHARPSRDLGSYPRWSS